MKVKLKICRKRKDSKMKKEILPLKSVIQGGAMWGNKSKQDKAVVSHAPPTASKHRPAEPFGLVLFEGVWC